MPHAAIASLHRRALDLAAGDQPALPDGVPPAEYLRTPAAAHVAALAAEAGLQHFHFERRAHLAHPEAWVPETDPSLAEPPGWEHGVLPEQKYHSFRHDLALASYHPQHRAKWAVHELCHGLVGFAWRPDATPFFHATAGRLAELLPVALWYFFDEAFLHRCADHQGMGSLFRTSCAACEAAARVYPEDPAAAAFVRDGLLFVDRELAAIARSRRLGRPVSHIWATLDLCADGVAYALAHAARLQSPVFRSWAERLLVAQGGWSPTLEDLEHRVADVLGGLLGTSRPAPLAPSPEHGRWRWILQDLGFRIATVQADTEGEATRELDALVDTLAAGVQATTRPDRSGDAVAAQATARLLQVRAAYEALNDEFELADPGEVFALGYPAPGAEDGAASLCEGVRSAFPLLSELYGARLPSLVSAFTAVDGWERAGLPQRFAAWATSELDAPVASLVRWEAATATLPPHVSRLPGPARAGQLRLVEGARVLDFPVDVLDLAERVERGAIDLDAAGGLLAHDGRGVDPAPQSLLLGRDAEGEVLVLDIDPATSAALRGHPLDPGPRLTPDEVAALTAVGALVPHSWAEVLDHPEA